MWKNITSGSINQGAQLEETRFSLAQLATGGTQHFESSVEL